MARGAPDYGIYVRPAIAYQAVWEDDFEAPLLRWIAGSSFGSANPILSTTEQWKGVQSVYFATVAATPEWSVIERNFPLVQLGKIGIEFFILLENRTPGYMQIRLNVHDGINQSYAELRLDRQARTASIVTPAGVIVVATNCFPQIPTNAWIPFKLVVDTNTDLYTRLLVSHTTYPISSHALVPVAVTNRSMLNAYIALQGDVGGARDAYLDNFVLTQNEP